MNGDLKELIGNCKVYSYDNLQELVEDFYKYGYDQECSLSEFIAYLTSINRFSIHKEYGIDYIQLTVCNYCNITPEQLHNNTRKREIVQARQVAMYFSKNLTKDSLATIGSRIGGKDHATVLHAVKTVNNLIDSDLIFKEQIRELECKIKGQPYNKTVFPEKLIQKPLKLAKKPIEKPTPKLSKKPEKTEQNSVKKIHVNDRYSNNNRNFEEPSFSKNAFNINKY